MEWLFSRGVSVACKDSRYWHAGHAVLVTGIICSELLVQQGNRSQGSNLIGCKGKFRLWPCHTNCYFAANCTGRVMTRVDSNAATGFVLRPLVRVGLPCPVGSSGSNYLGQCATEVCHSELYMASVPPEPTNRVVDHAYTHPSIKTDWWLHLSVSEWTLHSVQEIQHNHVRDAHPHPLIFKHLSPTHRADLQ